MRVKVSSGSVRGNAKQQYFLTAAAILKYFLGTSERVETLITCKSPDIELTTTDYELYCAFGSVKDYDNLVRARITKLLESVDISSHKKETGQEKKILTHGLIDELRKNAMKNNGGS